MSRGLQALDRIVTRLHGLELSAASTAVRHQVMDVAWAPVVPQGHTSYSWTGKSAPKQADPAASHDADLDADVGETKPSPVPASSSSPSSVLDSLLAQFGQLEFRVGKIVAVKRHPDADSLYVEQIDVGEASPREIVSGLVKYIPEERMIGARVVVFANLKPSKLRGVTSNGMVMCASNADRTTIEFVSPPDGAKPGDLVTLEGATKVDKFPEVNPKKKGNPWTECASFLKTDDDCVARFHGLAWISGSNGPCKAATLKQATIC